jgi:hypothetical protein
VGFANWGRPFAGVQRIDSSAKAEVALSEGVGQPVAALQEASMDCGHLSMRSPECQICFADLGT